MLSLSLYIYIYILTHSASKGTYTGDSHTTKIFLFFYRSYPDIHTYPHTRLLTLYGENLWLVFLLWLLMLYGNACDNVEMVFSTAVPPCLHLVLLLHYTVLHYITLYYIILYYNILYHSTILYYTILYYSTIITTIE